MMQVSITRSPSRTRSGFGLTRVNAKTHRALLWCVLITSGLTSSGPATAAGPEAGKQLEERVLFYLHGKIIEDQGSDAVSDRFGRYEYDAILESLGREGHRVISEVREPDTDVWEYAKKIVAEIEELKSKGLSSDRITVLGASKGAFITVLVSHLMRDADINYVLLATCSPQVLESWQEQGVCISGDVLAIHEMPDAFGGSCQTLAERCDAAINRFEEIELRLGVDHGVCYRPYDEWLAPALEWAR